MEAVPLALSEVKAHCSMSLDKVQEVKLTMTWHAEKHDHRTLPTGCGDDQELKSLNAQKEVPQIKDILMELSKLEAIFKIDCDILSQDPKRTVLINWSKTDVENRLHLIDFYSPLKSTRDKAYENLIKEPLLKILTDAGKVCLKLVGNAKQLAQLDYLSSPKVAEQNNGIFNVALRDIFSHSTKGLSALRVALEQLEKDPENLSASQLEDLILVRSLPGFYYDRQAVTQLLELSQFISLSEPSDRKARWAILGFLQVAGEYFDRLLPVTLSLVNDISDTAQTVLRRLRNTLSHLSQSKLNKLHDTSPNSKKTFENVLEDAERLTAGLQEIHERYKEMLKNKPADIWSQFTYPKPEVKDDDASEATASSHGKVSWDGFNKLIDLLTPQKDEQKPGDSLFYNETIRFSPVSCDLFMANEYFQQRKDLMSILSKAEKSGPTSELFDALEQKARDISTKFFLTRARCDTLFNEIKRLQDERVELYKSNNNAEAKEKEAQQTALKDTFIDELMHVRRDDHRKREEQKVHLEETHEKFRQLLLKKQELLGGHGNISEKYNEFLKLLQGEGVTVSEIDQKFSWTNDPTSNIEKLFHTVYRTGIFTKAGKDALRRTKIMKMLSVMDSIQDTVGIRTDLPFEITKKIHKDILKQKAQRLLRAINYLSSTHPEWNELCKLHSQLLTAVEQLQLQGKEDDIELLVDQANSTQNEIFEVLEEVPADQFSDPVDIKSLKQELEETSWNKKYDDLAQLYESEDLKKNHRNSLYMLDTINKMQAVFKNYQERMGKTIEHYAEHMEGALHSQSDDKQKDLRFHYSKFLLASEQLKRLDSAGDSPQYINQANTHQDAFDKLLESANSDQVNAVTYLLVRDTCKKKLTNIFQEYQTNFLAYQFIVATTYDMLKEFSDFPEFEFLKDTIQIRHYYFHGDPFKETPLVVHDGRNVECYRSNYLEGELAKEISILLVVVRYFLHHLAISLCPK